MFTWMANITETDYTNLCFFHYFFLFICIDIFNNTSFLLNNTS